APPRGRLRQGRGRRQRSCLEQLARDHQPLDLARSFSDGAELDVAIDALHEELLGESISSMDLHALRRGAARGFAGEQLRYRRFARVRLSLIAEKRGTPDEQA